MALFLTGCGLSIMLAVSWFKHLVFAEAGWLDSTTLMFSGRKWGSKNIATQEANIASFTLKANDMGVHIKLVITYRDGVKFVFRKTDILKIRSQELLNLWRTI